MRWQNLSAKKDRESRLPSLDVDAVRTFDAPEALDVRFYEVRARSAINRLPAGSRMPFRYTINPYRGCSHACAYCYARPTHKYLDLDPGRDFEREIVVKVNTPELVRAELGRRSWRGDHVALGTNTDPYQWAESRYRLMPGVWQAMRDFSNPCSLVTKSPLVLRDLTILREIASCTEISVYLSVPTLDERAWRETEPHTPSPKARLEALRKLNEAGVPAGVLVAPLIPGVNDDPALVEEIVSLAEAAGATSIGSIALHLRGEVREIWFGWLRRYRPDLVGRYERMYSRGAHMPSGERKALAGLVHSKRRNGTRQKSLPPVQSPGDSPSRRGQMQQALF